MRKTRVTGTRELSSRQPPPKEERVEDYLKLIPLELEIGYGLISLVDEARNGDLFARITNSGANWPLISASSSRRCGCVTIFSSIPNRVHDQDPRECRRNRHADDGSVSGDESREGPRRLSGSGSAKNRRSD